MHNTHCVPRIGLLAVLILAVSGPAAHAQEQTLIDEQLAALRQDRISYEFSYQEQSLPDMVNDPQLVRSTLETLRAVLPPEGLLEVNQVTPYFSEDFARYQQHIPGAMYWLGVSNSELGYVGMPHSPDFVADEESIIVGARAMAAVLLDFLMKH